MLVFLLFHKEFKVEAAVSDSFLIEVPIIFYASFKNLITKEYENLTLSNLIIYLFLLCL